jgi:glycosyltransferase involved in cell wall biosynthesis
LISDFRDEWLRFLLADFEFQSGDFARRQAEEIERAAIEASDVVLAVTRSSLDEIRGRYPEQPERKWALVPNGYDPDNFPAVAPPGEGTPGRMVVGHMGTAYKTASPRYYLDAIDRLPEAIRSRIETRFIGRIAETETEIFRGRGSDVKLLGFQPQSEALRLAAECDYLLLTMTNDFSLPGKLFEYFALGRPVLALSPRGGEVDRLLAETGAGWCAPHDDPAAIDGLLRSAWGRIERGERAFTPDWESIRRYERPRLAAWLHEELTRRLP